MNSMLYSYSLCIALPLMLFFGFYFLFAKTPDKSIYRNYLRSRRTMGVALLLLSLNYSVHFFFELRFRNVNAAILMNMSTYFLCYWLFSSAMTTLINRFYITRRRQRTHIAMWLLFTLLASLCLIVLPEGKPQKFCMLGLAAWLFSYGIFLSLRVLRAYHWAQKVFNDTHSDDIGMYIRWMSVFTYWALTFGVGCALLTFLPDDMVFVWILSSVPFYICLFCCYLSYLLFYEQVESAMEDEVAFKEDATPCEPEPVEISYAPSYHTKIAERIKAWTDTEGYVKPGLTIKDLADDLRTNRTYLSEYIKTTYDTTFRGWITTLRIDYAKDRMSQHPEQTIAEISSESGFLSMSHFMRTFKEREGCSPAKWRENNIAQ